MYLNYGFFKTFWLLVDCLINNKIIWIIFICCLVLGFIIYLNRNSKIINYIISIINLLIIILIVYYYHNYILSNLVFKHFDKNIYFYFLNSIIYLLLFNIYFYKKKSFIVIHYLLCLSFIIFSLFMTNYLNNVHLIIIVNIYPMIVYGNYLYFIFYIILFVKCFKKLLTKLK